MGNGTPNEDATPWFERQDASETGEHIDVRQVVAFRNGLSDEARRQFDATHYFEEIHGDYESWLDTHSHYRKRMLTDPDGRTWVEWTAPGLSKEEAERLAEEVREIYSSHEQASPEAPGLETPGA